MARRIEFQVDFGHPADRVFSAQTDERCVRERLAAVGGRKSELVSHEVSGGTTTMVMRQSIDPEHLPGIVQRVSPDGVTIERTEVWVADDRRGTVQAAVIGFTGSLRADTRITDLNGGSQLRIAGDVKVSIPLVGGKIEAVVADQLDELLHAEARFTNNWLDSRQA